METHGTADNEVKLSPKLGELVECCQNAGGILREIAGIGRSFFTRAGWKAWREMKGIYSKFTKFDYICGWLGMAVMCFAGLVVLSGFAVGGYQSYQWLLTGDWPQLNLMTAVDYFFGGTALQLWLEQPGSWLGLHSVVLWLLENIPLALALMLDGVLIALAMAGTLALGISFRIFQFKRSEKVAEPDNPVSVS